MSNPLSDSVRLEPLTKSHAALTFSWLHDPVLQELFFLNAEPDWNLHQVYFDKVLSDRSQHLFAIMRSDEHVGNCGLKHISREFESAEMWIYIGSPQVRGGGVGNLATSLLLSEAFRYSYVNTVFLHVAKSNTIARHVYEKNGFVEVDMFSQEWLARKAEVVCMKVDRSYS